ncbi:protein kinase [Sporothrix brasiliensis 5110]|uniref:non-specific serine/threonine protein kinase n=1 Tax=Sporothrix brasiliensis 5110 TaxID=1398154 RepID=A0A0C2FPP6_9PEZI|nr:protein kinase [Sporothrix brasiliensis 5110]KIH93033.1 protein kinase [Sporothrix brasiliensis 5110]
MTGLAPAQKQVRDAPKAAGTPGSTSDGRPGSSIRFQHQIEDTDFATKGQPAAGSQPGVVDANVTPEQLRDLTTSLGAARLQGLRVANFAYEPMSLPASRTVSHDDDSRHASGQQTPASGGSPMLSAGAHEIQSPPLTPSGTPYLDAERKSPLVPTDVASSQIPRHGVITPQESSKDASPPASRANLAVADNRPATSGDTSRRPVSSSGIHDQVLDGNHRKGMFSIGPTVSGSSGSVGGGKSLPVSREVSPSRNNSAAQFYTRPFTPAGDSHDPYAANKRQPQNKIEPRFMFSRLSKRKDPSPTASTISIPKHKDEKRHSGLFGNHQHKKNHDDAAQEDSQITHSRQSSMSDLKRFFKLGPSHHHKIKRAVSPAMSIRSAKLPGSKSSTQIPFGDEHSLTSKYGKLGKVLGAGAGGSVRLMKRSEDNTVFAVKEFRARHAYENEKDYVKKLTAEYCIGSSLHHGNIIETLDIIREKQKWYEVMEYAPYDLFAIVMTGQMTRAEVACCFLQIVSGVTYLHSMGLAHRDLKLDNVVVSEHGIMKIIDFGSAHVFKYPFESGVVMASGIVGSDPYLAPEVYDERKYDPTAVDIWSLAIIFCCMTLRRFPWKVPRLSDNSYKLFAAEPTPGHDPKKLAMAGRLGSSARADEEPLVEAAEKEKVEQPEQQAKEISDKKDVAEEKVNVTETNIKPETAEKTNNDDLTDKADKKDDVKEAVDKSAESGKAADKPAEKREVIRGPWRILRLLPRESRVVIGSMLAIDPKDRIKMADLIKDPWVADTVICRQIEPGRIIRSSTHTHILEQPTPVVK